MTSAPSPTTRCRVTSCAVVVGEPDGAADGAGGAVGRLGPARVDGGSAAAGSEARHGRERTRGPGTSGSARGSARRGAPGPAAATSCHPAPRRRHRRPPRARRAAVPASATCSDAERVAGPAGRARRRSATATGGRGGADLVDTVGALPTRRGELDRLASRRHRAAARRRRRGPGPQGRRRPRARRAGRARRGPPGPDVSRRRVWWRHGPLLVVGDDRGGRGRLPAGAGGSGAGGRALAAGCRRQAAGGRGDPGGRSRRTRDVHLGGDAGDQVAAVLERAGGGRRHRVRRRAPAAAR